MGVVDTNGTREKGPARITRESVSDSGRHQEKEGGQAHADSGTRRIRTKGMDAGRQIEQCVGHGMPKRTQRVHYKAVLDRGPNIFRAATIMLGGHGGPADFTEVGQEGTTTEGDEMRRVRGEFGQGDSAGRWLDLPS